MASRQPNKIEFEISQTFESNQQQMKIDTTNLCSHLQKKLFEPGGAYYAVWQALQHDNTLTVAVRARQLHIYRNGKKVLILAGKAQPKVIRDDVINDLIDKALFGKVVAN
jgi:hypothetical protein